jgi:hypothetical protein
VTNEWGFEDAIVMAGGRVTVETCPEVIPRDQLWRISPPSSESVIISTVF